MDLLNIPSATVLVLNQAAEVLREADKRELPMKSGTILARLVAKGINVGGSRPSVNLSAKLGRDPRFESHGHARGWTLRSRRGFMSGLPTGARRAPSGRRP